MGTLCPVTVDKADHAKRGAVCRRWSRGRTYCIFDSLLVIIPVAVCTHVSSALLRIFDQTTGPFLIGNYDYVFTCLFVLYSKNKMGGGGAYKAG